MVDVKELEEAARELEEFGPGLCEAIRGSVCDMDLATALMIEYVEEMPAAKAVIKTHWFTRLLWWVRLTIWRRRKRRDGR